MTDDNDLQRTLRDSPPPKSDPEAQSRAMAAAMAAFDAENFSADVQGNTVSARQTDRHSGLESIWRRLMNITLPPSRSLTLGGASLAVVALALMTTMETRSPGLPQPIGSQLPAEDRPVADIAAAEQEVAASPVPPAQPSVMTEAAPADAAVGQALSGNIATVLNQRKALRGTVASKSDVMEPPAPPPSLVGRDRFAEIETNPLKVTAEDPVATFSVDVDTSSYAFVRRQLNAGVLPQKDAVRVEEMINYFSYDYTPPESAETPFSTDIALMETPWNPETQLLRIAIQGYEITPEARPQANLVFLLDTSGSMQAEDRLPLLMNAFRMLVGTLQPTDTVSIVTYAGSAGVALEPTAVSNKGKILAALDQLRSGGSTAGGEGIRQAYALAEASFDPDGVNRVILATDGDFNVGITSDQELQGFVERKRESGIFLSVLGFGQGNLNDALMQTLAQNGNGQAAYIDTLNEARKVLVEEATSTLFPIAKDVKIQVEFNPGQVAEYRLIGYENRILAREDFNNDKVDAGEIGSGHQVTALFELTPTGGQTLIDPLRYADSPSTQASDEIAFVRMRYKLPTSDQSQLIERAVIPGDGTAANQDMRFAAAVAGFGQLLRDARYTGDFSFEDVISLATGARGSDPYGYRSEFVSLVRLAKTATAMKRQK